MRAYATNSVGTNYGNEQTFTTLDGLTCINNNHYGFGYYRNYCQLTVAILPSMAGLLLPLVGWYGAPHRNLRLKPIRV
jgi:hypothetical protein